LPDNRSATASKPTRFDGAARLIFAALGAVPEPHGPITSDGQIRRIDIFSGIIHEYHRAA
jgi:hypothetical protein